MCAGDPAGQAGLCSLALLGTANNQSRGSEVKGYLEMKSKATSDLGDFPLILGGVGGNGSQAPKT